MENNWKDLFYFSKKERRGIAVLCFLILLVALLPYIQQTFLPSRQPKIDFEKKLAALESKQSLLDSIVTAKTIQEITSKQNSPVQQTIDKTVALTTPKQPETNKEGKYDDYLKEEKVEIEAKSVLQIEINSATAQEFAQLMGIGEVLSARIVKFRNALGGFVSINQVGDTFGIEPEVFNRIKSKLILQNKSVTQLNINTESVQTLANHPYISDGLANQIVNFRQKVKPFETDEDVRSLYFMDEELFQKLNPYITY